MLTAKYELSRSNRDHLQLPIQIKLPKKRKSFCCIFFDFLVSTWNLQCSENNKLHRSIIIDSERWAHLNAQQGLFLKTFCKWRYYLASETSEICRKVLLSSNIFIILIRIDLAKSIFNPIWDFRTAS